MALFAYHFAMVKKYDKPERDAPFCEPNFLDAALFLDFAIKDLYVLFTKPGMTKMLPDRPNMPGMGPGPKVLVLNLNGVLVYQKYQLGVGMEFYKRPGLTAFINKMSK